MAHCTTLILSRTSIFSLQLNQPLKHSPRVSIRLLHSISAVNFSNSLFTSLISRNRGLRKAKTFKTSIRQYGCVGTAVSVETSDYLDKKNPLSDDLDPLEISKKDKVAELLTSKDDVTKLMKMERRSDAKNGTLSNRWFPYLDEFRAGEEVLNSSEVLEALDPYLMEVRKERFKNAVSNRSYSVCLVVEGLSDFGNASAAFRSADALGFQSVHVVSCEASKRCNNI